MSDSTANTNWQPMDSAPKTGEVFLADMGWPWPLLACWNKYESKWVYVMLQMNIVDGIDDPYFENDYDKDDALKKWMPLPDLDDKNERLNNEHDRKTPNTDQIQRTRPGHIHV